MLLTWLLAGFMHNLSEQGEIDAEVQVTMQSTKGLSFRYGLTGKVQSGPQPPVWNTCKLY
jgi:hypothetical protein